METVTITLRTGQRVEFDIETGLDGTAFFMFGVRRSGSSLFTNIVKALCEANHRHFVDASRFFDQDVRSRDWAHDPAVRAIIAPGNVYGGFREMPLAIYDNALLQTSPRLLLVRDPRDTLVSLYFATAYSHPLPRQQVGAGGLTHALSAQRARARSKPIDEYVIGSAGPLNRTLLEYSRLVELPGTILFHYEDVIFDKAEWIRQIVAAYGWQLDDDEMTAILGWADVRPDVEDPHKFVRRVTPGDHRVKLNPATIKTLNDLLAPVMETFGYQP